jgi:hypothetical protein
MYRHQQDHLPKALAKAKEAAEEIEAGTLFERLQAVHQETRTILREARAEGNHMIALQAIGRAEKQLELEAKLLGQLDEHVRVAVGINVETTRMQGQADLLAEAFTPEELVWLESKLVGAQARLSARATGASNSATVQQLDL